MYFNLVTRLKSFTFRLTTVKLNANAVAVMTESGNLYFSFPSDKDCLINNPFIS
ncbi:hypothetical protein Slin_0493 [Spirosoma linguale DSM 74]|uniref:Uncharacterized protein n=1 Tax=Spirosoma linguale (strain ATCC 33905 / DSM 74 / LMG 10896 / Claus 1) TaxID=504472 RepID=D2QF80_SPILD|nr:hypothetical protein Slin_0493 [Spirosoma linguale DSM 74]